MGRRKIEIKAIKDDRNRSVTFLKRKGGLFKKAHELSVLCSVDVAVIIFGNNKKLYEYSSSDIGEILHRYQFYGGPNEHKGPSDFNGKKDLEDDDDDDMGTPPPEGSHHSQEPPQMMPPQFQNQPPFQHIRHQTPSASPPIPNGASFHPHQRQHTPQPQGVSRPNSRNDIHRRQSSNLVPQHMPQASQAPHQMNGYTYMSGPPMYHGHGQGSMPQHPQHHTPPQQHLQHPSQQHPQIPHHPSQHPQQHPPQHPQQHQQHHPQYPYPPPQPQQQPPPHQLQQVYMEEQSRQVMPPTFPQPERLSSGPPASPPQTQQQPQQQVPEPVKRMPTSKSRSIFTPIDESRSVLAQHWVNSTSTAESSRSEATAASRPQSVDLGAMSRANGAVPSPPPPPRANTNTSLAHNKARTISASSVSEFAPPARTNSSMSGAGAKRPRLKVQIPDEPSDGGSATADSGSPRESTDNTGSHPSRRAGTDGSHSSGVVLPPPSPSASALLSASASGPPNPFARPHPPTQNQQNRDNTIDTPVSALPSRFMNSEFLPSPSSFYPGWDFRGGESNTLPSPLNFQTPVVGTGPSFLRDEGSSGAGAKRKTPEGERSEGDGGDAKRIKSEA